MKKKIIVSLCITAGLLIGIGSADTGKTLQEQFDIIKQTNYLNQVGLYFIDKKTKATPKEYLININQEENKEIYLLIKNDSNKDLHLQIHFANQYWSNQGQRGCGADYDNGFAKFITPSRKKHIFLPKTSVIEKTFTIRFPIGIEGLQRGCIAYSVSEDETTIQDNKKNPSTTIKIIKRKVIYLDAIVGNPAKIQYTINIGKIIKKTNKSGNFIVELGLENTGNIDADVSIQGEISNILGYKRPIVASGILLKGKNIKLSTNIGKLPFYKGLYTITLTVKHTPKFLFDAIKGGIDPNIITGAQKTITTRYFQAHRRMIIPFLIIIKFLYILFRKHLKPHKKDLKQKTSLEV